MLIKWHQDLCHVLQLKSINLCLLCVSEHQDKYFKVTKRQYPDYEDTLRALEETRMVAEEADQAIWEQKKQKEMDELVQKVAGIELKVNSQMIAKVFRMFQRQKKEDQVCAYVRAYAKKYLLHID